ncbi:MAG: tRNA pseudouridine synthase A [Candidatus Odinarchaeota archaeon]
MTKSKFLFKIYYIGKKRYYGSQRQINYLTIEQLILSALKKRGYIDNVCNSQFEFASRTDKYVSARGACFTCITKKKPVLMEINSTLPNEIGIWAYTKVPLEFNSRYNAIMRHYIYIYPTPLTRLQESVSIDLNLMQKACTLLEGRHDFINFSKRGKNEINTIRDMNSVFFTIKNDFITFSFKSRAFLRQQIRRMVKKVIDLGKGDIKYSEFLNLFDKSNLISFQPVDPSGLILWDIKFDKRIIFKEDQRSIERMNFFFLKNQLTFGHKHQLFRIMQKKILY